MWYPLEFVSKFEFYGLNLIKKRVSVIQCQEDSSGMPRLPISELYRVLDRQKHTLDYTYVNQATNSLFYN